LHKFIKIVKSVWICEYQFCRWKWKPINPRHKLRSKSMIFNVHDRTIITIWIWIPPSFFLLLPSSSFFLPSSFLSRSEFSLSFVPLFLCKIHDPIEPAPAAVRRSSPTTVASTTAVVDSFLAEFSFTQRPSQLTLASCKSMVVVLPFFLWKKEEKGSRKKKRRKKNQRWVVHCSIPWTCNQTIIIILKILDIKKLTERTKIVNGRRHKGPVWNTL